MGSESKRSWLKWLMTVVLLAAAGGGGFWYYQHQQDEAPEYQTAKVTRGDLIQVVTATGQLGPVLNVQVGSQISGIVRKLNVDYNSVVKSNEVIAEIDPSTYELNVQKAEAQVANSKANLALAQVQSKRAEELFGSRLISASDHDTASAQLQQAQAQVLIDQANLRNAQVQLSYCKIYAPVDGVVISRSVDVGQTVAASFNTPTVAVIANDLSKMQIDALVSEADIGGAAVGQEVTFTVDAYPYRTFRGKVSQIRYGAITNQNVINYDCVIGVSNADLKLLPGMTANVSIIIAQRDGVLRVPNAALRFRPPEAAGKTNAPAATVAQAGPSSAEGSRRNGAAREGRPGGGAGQRQDRGSGGEGAGGGARRQRPDRQVMRTLYVLPAQSGNAPAPLQPVQVRTGISDGIYTEVIEGLEEGAQVATGIISTTDSSSTARPTNPFGGGGPGFRRF